MSMQIFIPPQSLARVEMRCSEESNLEDTSEGENVEMAGVDRASRLFEI
jgi:hypothetical protein